MKQVGTDSVQSWLIALVCSFISMMNYGFARLSGMLFVASMEWFQVNRRQASLPFVLCDVLQATVGPLAGFLSHWLGLRGMVCLGSVLTSVGVGSCFFANNIETVTVLWGVIYGTGFGFSVLLLPVILNQYFVKHRATAIGLSNVGGVLGYFVLPQIFELLMNNYGLSGTFLVFGGIAMNCMPAAMLLRNPNFKSRRTIEDGTPKSTFERRGERRMKYSLAIEEDSERENKSDFQHGIEKIPMSKGCGMVNYGVSVNNFLETERQNNAITGPKNFCFKNLSAVSDVDLRAKPEKLVKSVDNLLDVRHQKHTSQNFPGINVRCLSHDAVHKLQTPEGEVTKDTFDKTCKMTASGNIQTKDESSGFSAFKIFLDPIFIFLSIVNAIVCFELIALITVIIDFARDVGIDMYFEKYIIMSFSLSGCFGLVAFGWVTDCGYLKSTTFGALAFMISCVMTIILPWVTSVTVFITTVSVWSMFQFVVIFLIPVIVGEYFDNKSQAMAMSSCYILAGPLYLTISPFVGFFRDDWGSYVYYFYMLSLGSFLSSIFLLLLPCIRMKN